MLDDFKKIGNILDTNSFSDRHIGRLLEKYYKALDNLSNKEDYYIIYGIPYYIPNNTSIGVSFSGGGDSTILLYTICKIIQEFNLNVKVYPITVIRHWDTAEWNEINKRKLYAHFKDLFNDIIESHIIGFMPSEFEFTPLERILSRCKTKLKYQHLVNIHAKADIYYFNEFTAWAERSYKLDMIFSGTTENPPRDANIPHSPNFRNRNLNVMMLSSEYFIGHLKDGLPFKCFDKSATYAQYKNFNIEDIYMQTQSCEIELGGCGDIENCFHCAERKWSEDNSSKFERK